MRAAEQPLHHAEGVLHPAAAVSQSAAAWRCRWSQTQLCQCCTTLSVSPRTCVQDLLHSLLGDVRLPLPDGLKLLRVRHQHLDTTRHSTAQHAAAASTGQRWPWWMFWPVNRGLRLAGHAAGRSRLDICWQTCCRAHARMVLQLLHNADTACPTHTLL
jgi:hypothetical protein